MLRLTYIYMDGCPACKKGKPPLEKFMRKHSKELVLVSHDLLNHPWSHDWQAEATPTYFIESGNGHPGVTYVGALDEKGLEKLLAKAKEIMKVQ